VTLLISVITENDYGAAIRHLDALITSKDLLFSVKGGCKMMQSYGAAVVQERSMRHGDREIARYLKWEYGEGTGMGFLNSWAIRRAPSHSERRFELVDRLGGLSASIRARLAAKLVAGWRRELTLLIEWKRGDLGTLELVDRLEALQRRTETLVPNLSP
jgi:hypothetical protein